MVYHVSYSTIATYLDLHQLPSQAPRRLGEIGRDRGIIPGWRYLISCMQSGVPG